MTKSTEIEQLVTEARTGNDPAFEKLSNIIRELLDVHVNQQYSKKPTHCTVSQLIHEVADEFGSDSFSWSNRLFFLAVAATQSRHVICHFENNRPQTTPADGEFSFTELNACLDELARLDERKVDILVLYYFAGLTIEEISEALSLKVKDIAIELTFTKAWVCNQLISD